MPEIAIRLDSEALPNPQADLRYLLPKALEERAPELLREDGYDYDSTNRMLIFLATSDLDAALAVVLAALEEIEILGNRFRDVTVAVADETHCSDNARYRVVAPRPGGSLVDS